MRKLYWILSPLFLPVAWAELPQPEGYPEVKVKREKITCFTEWKAKYYSEKGVFEAESSNDRRMSETFRTTWIEGEVELRQSDMTSYESEAKDRAISVTRALSHVTRKTLPNGLIVETVDSRGFTEYLPPLSGPGNRRLLDQKRVVETTMKVDGPRTTTVKVVENGVEMPGGSVQTETEISDKIKESKFTMNVPYIEMNLDDKGYAEILKSEATCRTEVLP